MGRYRHLTIEEREEIMCLRRQGAGVRAIARAIGRSPSTVSRELARNSCKRFYRASSAQRRSEGRRAACRRPRVLDAPALCAAVQEAILERRWSPEEVAGRLALELGGPVVSASPIYRAIHRRDLDTLALRHTARGLAGRFRRRGKAPKKRGGKPSSGARSRSAGRSPSALRRPSPARARVTGRPTPSLGRPAGRAWSRSWTAGAATSSAGWPPLGAPRTCAP